MIIFQSLLREDLEQLLIPLSRTEKLARVRARQIFIWVYQRHVTNWDQMTDISKEVRAWLNQNVSIFQLNQFQDQRSKDGTQKFLWKLEDQKTIESVVIPAALTEKTLLELTGPESQEPLESNEWSRLTACISSQVGCAMACKFCLTGIQGLDRNLETHEIVSQIFELRRRAPISNIVMMGMGEPLHNLENVIRAVKIFLDPLGFGFSKRRVTVSTSGLVPAIERLIEETDAAIAISLNATTDEQRSQIMPINKKYNIEQLLSVCRKIPRGPFRRITFEYVMLKGFNDSLEDAHRLVKLLSGIQAKVNLIPFNEHSGSEFKRPSDETVRKFQKILVDRKFTATVRISRGRDISAACGQLRSLFGTARGTNRHKDFQHPPSQSPA